MGRDTVFNDKEGLHFSFKEAARKCMQDGIGLTYKTHGDVWDVSNETRIVGMLELIYDKLKKAESNIDSERLEAHAMYLKWRFKYDKALLRDVKRNVNRIVKMCGGENILKRSQLWAYRRSIHDLASRYVDERCNSYSRMQTHDDLRCDVMGENEILKGIKTIDDLQSLNGIGKKTIARLKSKQKSNL